MEFATYKQVPPSIAEDLAKKATEDKKNVAQAGWGITKDLSTIVPDGIMTDRPEYARRQNTTVVVVLVIDY